MTTLILEVRGGGLFLRDANGLAMRLEAIDAPTSPGELGIPLVTKTALVGILSRLMGETRILYQHRQPPARGSDKLGQQEKTAALEAAQDSWDSPSHLTKARAGAVDLAVKMAKRARLVPVSGPTVTTFYERRDQGELVANPSSRIVDDWTAVVGSLQVVRDSLIHATGKNSPKEIFAAIVASNEAERRSQAAGGERRVLPDISSVPVNVRGSLGEAIGREIERFRADSYTNKFGKEKEGARASEVSLRFLTHLAGRCAEDKTLRDALSKVASKKDGDSTSASIIFSPNPAQPKAWLKASHYEYVRGRPSWLILADFDVVIEDVPEEALELLDIGPQMASWAEGGRVLFRFEKDGNWQPSADRPSQTQIYASRADLLSGGYEAKDLPRALFGLPKAEAPAKKTAKHGQKRTA